MRKIKGSKGFSKYNANPVSERQKERDILQKHFKKSFKYIRSKNNNNKKTARDAMDEQQVEGLL